MGMGGGGGGKKKEKWGGGGGGGECIHCYGEETSGKGTTWMTQA